jgi:hypothetical protein
LLVLDRLDGVCVPVGALTRHLGAVRITNDCSDGYVCNGADVPRRSPSLVIALPDPPNLSACASSIVLDSEPTPRAGMS